MYIFLLCHCFVASYAHIEELTIDVSLCIRKVFNLDVTEESWNGLLKKVLQNQISIATVM